VELGASHDLVAAGHLDELQPARSAVVGTDRFEGGLDVLPRLGVQQLVKRLERERLRRRENQRFDDRFEVIGHWLHPRI
jgi:hypothetical protein